GGFDGVDRVATWRDVLWVGGEDRGVPARRSRGAGTGARGADARRRSRPSSAGSPRRGRSAVDPPGLGDGEALPLGIGVDVRVARTFERVALVDRWPSDPRWHPGLPDAHPGV